VLIGPPRSGNSWSEIVTFASTTHQPTPPGSIRLRSGFPKFSVMSSHAASSVRLKILLENSSTTSVATTKRPDPLSGLTPKLRDAFAPPRNQCNSALAPPVCQLRPSPARSAQIVLPGCPVSSRHTSKEESADCAPSATALRSMHTGPKSIAPETRHRSSGRCAEALRSCS